MTEIRARYACLRSKTGALEIRRFAHVCWLLQHSVWVFFTSSFQLLLGLQWYNLHPMASLRHAHSTISSNH